MVLITAIITLPIYYFLFKEFKNNQNLFDKKLPKYFSISLILLLIWFILGFLAEDPFYSLAFILIPLIYGFVIREKLRIILKPFLFNNFFLFIILFLFLFILEISAGLDQKENILIHQLKYFGFYFGMASTLFFFLKKYHFKFLSVLTIGGLWGVIIEQNFKGPIMLFTDPFGFPFFALFTFLVYGFYLGGPYLLFYEEFNKKEKKKQIYGTKFYFSFVSQLFPY